MKTLQLISTFVLLGGLLSACNKDIDSSTPRCISKKINSFKEEACDDARVDAYFFNSEKVFVFEAGTCIPDAQSDVYSEECELLGTLGGIVGNTTIQGKKYKSYTDDALVLECLKHHREAQKELYDRYCVQMKGICMRFASSETEAEDLLQESFIRVFTGLKKYTSGSLGAWIRTITINTAIEFYRKQKIRREHYDNLSLSSVDEELVLDHIALEDLLKKIQSLPNGYRVVFNLYEIEGYNHREIGEKLGISEGTSKSQLARAKQVLREQLKAEENYERNQLKNVE